MWIVMRFDRSRRIHFRKKLSFSISRGKSGLQSRKTFSLTKKTAPPTVASTAFAAASSTFSVPLAPAHSVFHRRSKAFCELDASTVDSNANTRQASGAVFVHQKAKAAINPGNENVR